jgi:hypothetical protein
MMADPVSSFVRAAPRIFYAFGILDFFKNMVPLYTYLTTGAFRSIDYNTDLRPQIAVLILSAAIYAMQWIAYGVFAALLLAVLDEVRALRAKDVTGQQDYSDA